MSALKVGLIGCGRIAQSVHLNILTRLPDVELIALAESDPQRQEEARCRSPVPVFANYQELLAMDKLEAVVICLPSWLHAEAAIAALHCGKHLYLEKPLATSLSEANRVIAAWRQSGAKAMIGFNYRFNPLQLEGRALLQGGQIGKVVEVRSVFASRWHGHPDWMRKRETGGGVLLELASHHFDLLPYLLGSHVREVHAMIASVVAEDDHAAISIRLEDDTIVQSSFFFGPVREDRFEVYGRNGKLVIDRLRSLRVEVAEDPDVTPRFHRLLHTLGGIMRSRLLGDDLLAPTREPSYARALTHFVDCVRHHRAPSPDLWDGRRSLAVIEAAEESARTGRAVSLPNLANEDSAR